MTAKAGGASFGRDFELTLVTNDPSLAQAADRAGLARIGLDLERLGKSGRQDGGRNRLSDHLWEDLARIAGAVSAAKVFVRVDPLNPDSAQDVSRAVDAGAQVIMLPFFRSVQEASRFLELVDGRLHVSLLVETGAALAGIAAIAALAGVGDIMFGLNDLRLDLKMDNHFEILTSPLLDAAAKEVLVRGHRLSIGGVARADQSDLPIQSELVYAQYPRLGATGAWLSRSFVRPGPDGVDRLAEDIERLRARLDDWGGRPAEALEEARARLTERASGLRL